MFYIESGSTNSVSTYVVWSPSPQTEIIEATQAVFTIHWKGLGTHTLCQCIHCDQTLHWTAWKILMWHSWVYSHWDTGSVPGEVGSESYTDLVYIIIELNIYHLDHQVSVRLTSHLSWTRACILRESTYVAVPHQDLQCCSVHGSVTINAAGRECGSPHPSDWQCYFNDP